MKSDEGVGIETICRILNIGRRYFYELKRLPGTPPDVSKGRYNASSWVMWYVRYLGAELERRGSPGGPESGAMQAARLNLISGQVQRIEMENAVAAGTLLEADTVEISTVRKLANCKARLRSIPSSLGPQLVNRPGADCTNRLAVAIDQALAELDGDLTGRAS